MTFKNKCACTALALSLCPAAASAQDNGWEFFGSIYLWSTSVDIDSATPLGSTSGTLSFSDALENLEFGFMGAFEARKGRWSLFTDLVYTDLAFRDTVTTIPGFTNSRFGNKITIWSGIAAYRVLEDDGVALDLGGGFRYINIDNDLTLRGAGPSTTFSGSDASTDAVVAARANIPLGDRTSATLYLDYGYASSTSNSWQALATINYDLNDRWMLRGGYRYLDFERNVGATNNDFAYSGILFGATYQF
ncbi:MAG: porin family protein [Pseudomonadota bacterium]